MSPAKRQWQAEYTAEELCEMVLAQSQPEMLKTASAAQIGHVQIRCSQLNHHVDQLLRRSRTDHARMRGSLERHGRRISKEVTGPNNQLLRERSADLDLDDAPFLKEILNCRFLCETCLHAFRDANVHPTLHVGADMAEERLALDASCDAVFAVANMPAVRQLLHERRSALDAAMTQKQKNPKAVLELIQHILAAMKEELLELPPDAPDAHRQIFAALIREFSGLDNQFAQLPQDVKFRFHLEDREIVNATFFHYKIDRVLEMFSKQVQRGPTDQELKLMIYLAKGMVKAEAILHHLWNPSIWK